MSSTEHDDDDDEFAIPAEPKHYRMQALGGHFATLETPPPQFPAFGTAYETQEMTDGIRIQ